LSKNPENFLRAEGSHEILEAQGPMDERDRPRRSGVLLALIVGVLASFGLTVAALSDPAYAQACPPYCETPIITPAWHIHMCDVPYQEQLDDNRCMHGPGMTEFPAGTDRVWIIYCHQFTDTVVIQIRDQGGGIQYVNHPDGITYQGDGCESLLFTRPAGIAPAGSPYKTSAYWPEGPFSGVSPGVEWYIGLFIAFDEEIYYGNAAQALVTARDPAANTELFVTDSLQAHLYSDSDPTGFMVTLTEELPSFPLFKITTPIGFSQIASDPSRNIIKVANRDTVTISYCPRNCTTPFVDTAVWYALSSTITPTPLPTWPGAPPTATPTPPPEIQVEYVTIRPSPLDVGYAPELTNLGRPNHLGYPDMFVGMWTAGRNPHHGMVRFDLQAIPENATVLDARLELIGRSNRLTEPGAWAVKVLDSSADASWRELTFDQVRSAPSLGQLGPTLSDAQLGNGRMNSFGFTSNQLQWITDRRSSSGYLSFRVDGPGGSDNNLFAWETGVDIYGRAPEPPDPAKGPALQLSYVRSGETGPPSPTIISSPGAGTAPPTAGPGTASVTVGPGTPSPTPQGPTAGPGTASATAGPGTAPATAGPGTASLTPGPGTPSATPSGPTAGPGTASATVGPGTEPATAGPGTASATVGPGTAPATAGPGTASATAGPGTASSTPVDPTAGPGTASATPDGPTAGPGTASTTPTGPTAGPGTASSTPGPGTPGFETPIGGSPGPTTPGAGTPGGPPGPGTPGYGATATPSPLPTDTSTPDGPLIGRQVCLVAFTDQNADGRRDASERLLPGVTIRLTHVDSGAFLSWTTDAANLPDHCWAGLIDGEYKLRVVELPAGYVATGLVERTFHPPFTTESVLYEFGAHLGPIPTHTLEPTVESATATSTPPPTARPTATAQPTVTGPSGELCLAVYHDRNGDGFRDIGEGYLLDVRMRIRADSGAVARELLSDNGLVCSRLSVGVYMAEVDLHPGREASSLQEQTVLLTLDDRVAVEFGQRISSRGASVYLPFAQKRPR
jgi:hypothetical protein